MDTGPLVANHQTPSVNCWPISSHHQSTGGQSHVKFYQEMRMTETFSDNVINVTSIVKQKTLHVRSNIIKRRIKKFTCHMSHVKSHTSQDLQKVSKLLLLACSMQLWPPKMAHREGPTEVPSRGSWPA